MTQPWALIGDLLRGWLSMVIKNIILYDMIIKYPRRNPKGSGGVVQGTTIKSYCTKQLKWY
jgi:hypothetical protein